MSLIQVNGESQKMKWWTQQIDNLFDNRIGYNACLYIGDSTPARNTKFPSLDPSIHFQHDTSAYYLLNFCIELRNICCLLSPVNVPMSSSIPDCCVPLCREMLGPFVSLFILIKSLPVHLPHLPSAYFANCLIHFSQRLLSNWDEIVTNLDRKP